MPTDFLSEGTGTFTYSVANSRSIRDRWARARELWTLAVRNVGRNRRRSLITGTMVAVGVIAILFCKAYIAGVQQMIEVDMGEAVNGAMQVQRKGYAASRDLAPLDLDLPGSGALLQKIRSLEDVTDVAPRLSFGGLLSNGDISTMVSVVGLDPAAEAIVCPKGPGGHSERLKGPGLTQINEAGVILGNQLAEGLNLKVGQSVTVLAQTRPGGMDAVDVTVQGIFDLRDPWLSKHLIVIPLAVAQRLLHMPDRVTAFALRIREIKRLESVRQQVVGVLAPLEPASETRAWSDLVPFYRDCSMVMNTVLKVVIVIVFALVLAGVINTLLMSVYERTREVGTLMSIGYTRARIIILFLLEALVLGGVASIVGGVVGTGLILIANARGVTFYVPDVGEVLNRPVLDMSFLLFATLGTLLGVVVGGLYPAYRAARLRPVEALQGA